MALKPRRGTWAYGPDTHSPVDAARWLAWNGSDDPGDWHAVTRAFRDGHTGTLYAADATLAAGAARGAPLAFPLDRAAALVACLVQGAPAAAVAGLMDSVAAGCGLYLYLRN